MPDGNAKAFYPAYDPTPALSQTGRGKYKKTLPQRISCYRKAASEHIPSSIVHYVAGARECGQRACSAKDAGGPLESSVMNDQIYQRIEDSARFRELVEKRQRFATILSVIMLAVYISFILLIAFAPGWLGTPLHAGTSVTRGIPIGVGVIVISFVLTGIYIWRANGEFDRLNNAVLHEVKAL
ncbi:Inner membrane protein yjcH [Salmonella enterica subsp. enterica serovar Bovismorbificans]|nr:Inner membrane protein yjcH [Salmonella enterica subsp. enterica serovar Bovismorbificans]CNU53970.1 Inner membrane protein yjcH [Salmonella enterica subsp. enterica serovar Bovismorbificans]CNU94435.1 Inner membrane protein yjcH [Salmonella enterica subsp. enterica serovar Bovismorbificans]CNU99888.1 Inner membrane protein yjcH [Salmonella enterica subsp. enterica serovar Bovismorbificans]CNU99964.1 Inner membrane protein yjcH [Salmonella enterica subsp. enterica serovar Bovismorbificans]